MLARRFLPSAALVWFLTATLILSFALPSMAKTTLSVWLMSLSPTYDTIVKKHVARFEELNPDIAIDLQIIPYTGSPEKFRTAVAGGTAPDVGHTNLNRLIPLESMGGLVPLDDYIKADNLKSAYVSEILNYGFYKGKQFAIPMLAYARGLYYNTRIFSAAGVSPPTTWGEFLEVSKKVSRDLDGDGKKDQWAFTFFPDSWISAFIPWLTQAGGNVLSEDGKQATISSPEAKSALQFLYDLEFVYGAMPPGGALQRSQTDLFATEKVAMNIGSPNYIDTAKSLNPQLQFNVTLPLTGKIYMGYGGADPCLSIFSNSKHKKEGWRFIRFMTTDVEFQRELASTMLFFPVTNVRCDYKDPRMEVFRKAYSLPFCNVVNHPRTEEISSIVAKEIQQAFMKTKSVSQALEDAAAAIQPLLEF